MKSNQKAIRLHRSLFRQHWPICSIGSETPPESPPLRSRSLYMGAQRDPVGKRSLPWPISAATVGPGHLALGTRPSALGTQQSAPSSERLEPSAEQ